MRSESAVIYIILRFSHVVYAKIQLKASSSVLQNVADVECRCRTLRCCCRCVRENVSVFVVTWSRTSMRGRPSVSRRCAVARWRSSPVSTPRSSAESAAQPRSTSLRRTWTWRRSATNSPTSYQFITPCSALDLTERWRTHVVRSHRLFTFACHLV